MSGGQDGSKGSIGASRYIMLSGFDVLLGSVIVELVILITLFRPAADKSATCEVRVALVETSNA